MKRAAAKNASRKKYYVRIMRPVFQRVLLEVDATSEEEARRIAVGRAEAMRDNEWDDTESDFDQPMIVERVVGEDELEEIAVDDPRDLVSEIGHAYALLQADLETVEGEVIPLELLERIANLALADVASDWIAQLEELRSEHAEEFWVRLKTRDRGHATLRSLLEELRKSRPDASEDDDEG